MGDEEEEGKGRRRWKKGGRWRWKGLEGRGFGEELKTAVRIRYASLIIYP